MDWANFYNGIASGLAVVGLDIYSMPGARPTTHAKGVAPGTDRQPIFALGGLAGRTCCTFRLSEGGFGQPKSTPASQSWLRLTDQQMLLLELNLEP